MSVTTLYRAYDTDGTLLYVGVTGAPLRRFSQHDGKPWWTQVEDVRLSHFDTQADALAAERAAIENETPRYNVRHRADRRSPNIRRGPNSQTIAHAALATILAERGMAPQELAEMAGVSTTTVYNILRGRRYPQARIRAQIAAALSVAVVDLFPVERKAAA